MPIFMEYDCEPHKEFLLPLLQNIQTQGEYGSEVKDVSIWMHPRDFWEAYNSSLKVPNLHLLNVVIDCDLGEIKEYNLNHDFVTVKQLWIRNKKYFDQS